MTATNQPTGIEVKYCNGKFRAKHFGGSASVVTQILDAIQTKLTAIGGHYRWVLDGHTGSYSVVARSSKGSFVESTGKTPGEALFGFLTARNILVRDFGFIPTTSWKVAFAKRREVSHA